MLFRSGNGCCPEKHGFVNFSRSALIIDGFLVIFLTAGYRVGMRLYFGIIKGGELARNPGLFP